jgi:hypothetical protein
VDQVVTDLSAGTADPAGTAAALRRVLSSKTEPVAVQAALDAANTRNRAVHNANRQLLHPVMQQFNGNSSSSMAIDGTFPTTTCLKSDYPEHTQALRQTSNGTVIVLTCLAGGGGALHDAAVLSDMMPTTVAGGRYTDCPQQQHYALFTVSHKQHLRSLYAGGLRVFVAIGLLNEQRFTDALCEGPFTSTTVLESNCSRLVLVQCGSSGREFVMLLPYEHMSHCVWQALKRANRLWLLAGLVDLFSALAALQKRPALDAEQLLLIVGPDKLEGGRGWYTSGAYCESVMRGARRLQFRALFGTSEGDLKWQQWYRECKQRAGVLHGDFNCSPFAASLSCHVAATSWHMFITNSSNNTFVTSVNWRSSMASILADTHFIICVAYDELLHYWKCLLFCSCMLQRQCSLLLTAFRQRNASAHCCLHAPLAVRQSLFGGNHSC